MSVSAVSLPLQMQEHKCSEGVENGNHVSQDGVQCLSDLVHSCYVEVGEWPDQLNTNHFLTFVLRNLAHFVGYVGYCTIPR